MEGRGFCPYPQRDTYQAIKHVAGVFEVDGHFMSWICTGTPEANFLGCTFKNELGLYPIFVLTSLNRVEKRDTYYHELCHVYEIENLGKSAQESALHIGWVTGE